MPRLQAWIDEIDLIIHERGPVIYDDEPLWGEIVLTFKDGERVDKMDIHQTKVNSVKRKNPSRKGSGDGLDK